MARKKVVAEIQATYNRRNEVQAIKVSSSDTVNRYIRKVYPMDLEIRDFHSLAGNDRNGFGRAIFLAAYGLFSLL